MKRDLKHVYRVHGIKYFAFPVVVLLLAALMMDERLGGYLEVRQDVKDLAARMEADQQTLELNSKIEDRFKTLEPQHAQMSQKVFLTPNAAQSTQDMQEKLRQILQSLYFDGIQFSDATESASPSSTRISVTARFNGVPQQLPRLQSALLQNPQLLSVESLEITVTPDATRGGQQISVVARFTGLHMNQAVSPPSTPASGAKT